MRFNREDLPESLQRTGDFLADKLLPMAKAAGLVPTNWQMHDLARQQPPDAGEVHRLLAVLVQLVAVASLSWAHDQSEEESARLIAAAEAFAQYVHGFIAHASGAGAVDALAEARSHIARAAANARHAPTRDARRLVTSWWHANGAGKMTKEAAADAIMAARLVGDSRRTVRGWLVGL